MDGFARMPVTNQRGDPSKLVDVTTKNKDIAIHGFAGMSSRDVATLLKLGARPKETRAYRTKTAGSLPILADNSPPESEVADDDTSFGVGSVDNADLGEHDAEMAGEETKTDDDLDNDTRLDDNVLPGEDDWNNDGHINVGINTAMCDSFKAYCDHMYANALPELTDAQVLGVKLMDILRRKRAPLDTYDEVMRWHLESTGKIDEGDRLSTYAGYISRKTLVKQLKERYNMVNKFPITKPIVLPISKARVELVCHNAWGCMESLLTDPRITDDDFWFFGNDPRAEPPESVQLVGDLHTGKAYREAVKVYKQGIPNRVPLPIVFYIDGADTGQMKNMPITALKMSLGIHTRKYRDEDHAWRTLGHVASVTKAQSKAKKIAIASKHIAVVNSQLADGEGDANNGEDDEIGRGPTQDFHAMLDVILESYRDLQTRGFKWDLHYRGHTYRDLEFIPFVVFVKCDTKEADTLCGSYTNYNKGVSHLCRYCHCPNKETDNPDARFGFKTTSTVKPLVDLGDLAALKAISQHNIDNAFYKIRFSPISTRGIHGACASEMLHAVLLGNFAYLRDTLYEQVGPTSEHADTIDDLSQLYGKWMGRQSERDMPNCHFGNGIREGKLNAKEYRGILLVMAALLRSFEGREKLGKHSGFTQQRLQDWAELVEILLGWEAFLGQSEMSIRHVSRLGIKNRFIMWMIKKVAYRKKGMGLRLMKFHAIVHLAYDIILFGVPMEFDTGSNEKGHKATKVAARMTQKNKVSFDWQTSIRLDEFMLIDLALEEMDGRKLWEYFDQEATGRSADEGSSNEDEEEDATETGGATINIFETEQGNPCYSIGVGKQARLPDPVKWDDSLLWFLHDLQAKLAKWRPKLVVRSEHRRNGQIFRGHPHYRGTEWKDWALVDWCNAEPEPVQIWCFVVLSDLPKSKKKRQKHRDKLVHGACELHNGVFAVVECATWIPQPAYMERSLLFRKLRLEMASNTTGSASIKRRFYLVDTEALAEPAFIVPDFGCRDRRTYFHIKNRKDWIIAFEKWLDQPNPPEYLADKAGRQFESVPI